MVYLRFAVSARIDGHLRIALNDTCSHIIATGRIHIALTAAIDVTEFSTALAGGSDGTARDIHSGIRSYCTHLTTAIDAALNGTAIDINRRRLRCCQQCPMISTIERSTVKFGETSHRAAKHISTMLALRIVCKLLTDRSAINRHGDITALEAANFSTSILTIFTFSPIAISIVLHFTISIVIISAKAFLSSQVQAIAHRGQTSTAIDRTKHSTTIDGQINRAAYITGGQCLTTKSTTTTEHVTIHVCGTDRTNSRTCTISLAYGNRRVSQYVTILTTAEYRSINPTALNLNDSILHIRFLVEVDTLVTLSCTEEVTSHRMILNLLSRTRHANRSARHGNMSRTQHIGSLVTTIDVRQDMTTADFHV